MDYRNLVEVANTMATRLAEAATTDVELSEALLTEKTELGVRIGGYEVTYAHEHDERIYDIINPEAAIEIHNVVFYPNVRFIISKLLAGYCPLRGVIAEVLRDNNQYRIARDTVYQHIELVRHYYKTGNEFRATLHEDRLDRARARAQFLKARLLERALPY